MKGTVGSVATDYAFMGPGEICGLMYQRALENPCDKRVLPDNLGYGKSTTFTEAA